MNVNILIKLVAVLMVLSSFASSPERISWSEDRPLQWFDFKGQPDYSDQFRDAVTASALKFNTKCLDNNELEVLVAAEFLKDRSWVKEVARSDYHLGHERLHFDITELYARKFRQEISERQLTCSNQDEIQELIHFYLDACFTFQNEYDKQTYYSMHQSKQIDWENQISKELKSLEEFALN